jgi:hypothetical protein
LANVSYAPRAEIRLVGNIADAKEGASIYLQLRSRTLNTVACRRAAES